MIPVVGVMAASGILKGLLALLTQFNVVAGDSDTYRLISAMSDSMFFFLPMIIGFTAAKRLGSNPIIVAIIGGVMVYPAVVEMARSRRSGRPSPSWGTRASRRPRCRAPRTGARRPG